MEFHGFMLANYAEVNQGLLYVQGGGWDSATIDRTPATLSSFVAGHFILPPDATLDNTPVQVALETPAGELVPVVSMIAALTRSDPFDGEARLAPAVVPVRLPIAQGGRHAVLVSAGEASVRLPVFIRVPPNT